MQSGVIEASLETGSSIRLSDGGTLKGALGLALDDDPVVHLLHEGDARIDDWGGCAGAGFLDWEGGVRASFGVAADRGGVCIGGCDRGGGETAVGEGGLGVDGQGGWCDECHFGMGFGGGVRLWEW